MCKHITLVVSTPNLKKVSKQFTDIFAEIAVFYVNDTFIACERYVALIIRRKHFK